MDEIEELYEDEIRRIRGGRPEMSADDVVSRTGCSEEKAQRSVEFVQYVMKIVDAMKEYDDYEKSRYG